MWIALNITTALANYGWNMINLLKMLYNYVIFADVFFELRD